MYSEVRYLDLAKSLYHRFRSAGRFSDFCHESESLML